MKTIQIRHWLLVILAVVLLTLPACTSGRAITGEELDAVTVYADPTADAILQSFAALDYEAFASDFNDQMKASISQGSFESMVESFENKLGAYQSREVTGAREIQDFVTVTYDLKFEKADNVTMRLSMNKDEPHLITGLWFNAPELN